MNKLAILITSSFLSAGVANAEPTTFTSEELAKKAAELGFQNSTELRSYFEIAEVTVSEDVRDFSPEELALTGVSIGNGTANTAGGIPEIIQSLGLDLGDVKAWITLGLKIWDIVKANQPVVNVQTQTVSVLPSIQPKWQEMETWKGPQAKSYTIAAKNLYGLTVMAHTYTVAFHYGGSLGGHGQFLANATIIPTNVSASWGFTLDSSVKVGEPLNGGTRLDPIPGIGLGLEWSMSSFLSKRLGRDQFYVRGDGTTSFVNEL